MSVIVGRALPDVRDGLKPVHRRILFAMHDLGMVPSKPYRRALGPCSRRQHDTLFIRSWLNPAAPNTPCRSLLLMIKQPLHR